MTESAAGAAPDRPGGERRRRYNPVSTGSERPAEAFTQRQTMKRHQHYLALGVMWIAAAIVFALV